MDDSEHDHPTITVERFKALSIHEKEEPSPNPAPAPSSSDSGLLPVSPLLQPSLTGSSAYSTGSLEDPAPEAEEIKDAHTLTIEPKPFASGGYADVHRGTWTPPGKSQPVVVAVKVLRLNGLAEDMTTDYETQLSRIDKHLAREMYTWQQLHDKRVTPLYGWMGSKNQFFKGDRPLLVAPYFSNKNLRIYLHNNPGADRLRLLQQAAEGLNYIHTRKPYPIAHLDVKANVLIDDDGDASICDFGVSCVLDNICHGWTTSSPAYTVQFASPEVLRGDKANCSADVWSFAGLILQVLSGQPPYHKLHRNVFKIMQSVESGVTPQPEDHPCPQLQPAAVEVLWKLLVRCWSPAAGARPLMSEVMTQLEEVRRLTKVALQA